MESLKDLKLHYLVRRRDNNITGRNFKPRGASLEALPPVSRDLDANVKLVIVSHLATGTLTCSGVAYHLDNSGSGEVVLFDVSVERSRKAAWHLPFPVAGT